MSKKVNKQAEGFALEILVYYYRDGLNINNIVLKAGVYRSSILKLELAPFQKELENERLRSLAYDTMIDVAEEMFNIPIRKKLAPNTPTTLIPTTSLSAYARNSLC